MELLLKQPLSCGPKSNNLSRLQRSSPVNAGSNIGKSRIDRVQRNLKLGGNTDKEVRPELIVYQLGAFLFTHRCRGIMLLKWCIGGAGSLIKNIFNVMHKVYL